MFELYRIYDACMMYNCAPVSIHARDCFYTICPSFLLHHRGYICLVLLSSEELFLQNMFIASIASPTPHLRCAVYIYMRRCFFIFFFLLSLSSAGERTTTSQYNASTGVLLSLHTACAHIFCDGTTDAPSRSCLPTHVGFLHPEAGNCNECAGGGPRVHRALSFSTVCPVGTSYLHTHTAGHPTRCPDEWTACQPECPAFRVPSISGPLPWRLQTLPRYLFLQDQCRRSARAW